MLSIQTRYHTLQLSEIERGSFEVTMMLTEEEDGLVFVHIEWHSPVPSSLLPCSLSWDHPLVDIHAFWRTGGDHHKTLLPDFARPFRSTAMSQAPICCLHSLSGLNRLTFALSDALHTIEMVAGVHEETARLNCTMKLFSEPLPPTQHYGITLRLDTRSIPYYEALAATQQWWAEQPEYEPAFVPESARLPLYSTWYSFHQQVAAEPIEEQCHLARELGCAMVIVDDGWQTTDSARGYAYTGDWEVVQEKFPDMPAHVARVHALGMKYVLWYSVPFVGHESKAYSRFADKMLYTMSEEFHAAVLDPRFPDVREYIIATYEQAMRIWNLDGFKLDFVDCFTPPGQIVPPECAEHDYHSVPEAVDRLLKDLLVRLRAMRSDVVIEFRQSYIGPLMRTYGNMFRAADCPNDALTNRIRTLDLRLLSGKTAVHSDMLMWHRDEPVESAALQLINVLFAVPQISVQIQTLPASHLAMLRFWLAFWREHREVLLDGKLVPLHPETHYPLVSASTERKTIVVAYQNMPIKIDKHLPETLILVNGSLESGLVLVFAEDAGTKHLVTYTCQGEKLPEQFLTLKQGLLLLDIPPAGVGIVTNSP